MTLQTGVSHFSARTLRHVQADLADMVAHHCTYADTMREIVWRILGEAFAELRDSEQPI
jgi:hypothetical protein